jgi:hypothetical protein
MHVNDERRKRQDADTAAGVAICGLSLLTSTGRRRKKSERHFAKCRTSSTNNERIQRRDVTRFSGDQQPTLGGFKSLALEGNKCSIRVLHVLHTSFSAGDLLPLPTMKGRRQRHTATVSPSFFFALYIFLCVD